MKKELRVLFQWVSKRLRMIASLKSSSLNRRVNMPVKIPTTVAKTYKKSANVNVVAKFYNDPSMEKMMNGLMKALVVKNFKKTVLRKAWKLEKASR